MKRYLVSFTEVRHYQMIVRATDEEKAVALAQNGPDHPVRIDTELRDYEAEELDGGAA